MSTSQPPTTLSHTPPSAFSPMLADNAWVWDRKVKAPWLALTGGLSPISLGLALADWAWHLGTSPGTRMRLLSESVDHWLASLKQVGCQDHPHQDKRYADAAWALWPFCALASTHHTAERWWDHATHMRGMEHHHQDVVHLMARQWLDMLSPSNWPHSNPQVLKTTFETQGENLRQGWSHAWQDMQRQLNPSAPMDGDALYRPGIEVACTPGAVVHRNHLVELLQYTPTTAQVQREPVFIVPSWIMKYYILDLSPHNSLVRYLVDQGHTVYMLSWRNPDASDALLDMEDYLRLGVLNPLAVITERTGGVPIHAVGYCLGGTLLSIAAAALARDETMKDAQTLAPLATLTLLATQLDFQDAGEMGVLLDEAQVAVLEDIMAEKGFLTGRQMGGSFQFLHAQDLIWSARMREYWLGERVSSNDLMAWNADVTRMPATMHSQYLHQMYLHNDLANGRYKVEGQPVSLGDLRVPVFAVGTQKDHVTPWRSAYKVHSLTRSDVTFVLTSGGHNAGIVSEPGHAHRSYQLLHTPLTAESTAPEIWQRRAPRFTGSWWPAWHEWLRSHGGAHVAAREISPVDVLEPAPGSYVQVRYGD